MTLLKNDLVAVQSEIEARLQKKEFLTSEFIRFIIENCEESEELLFAIEGHARIGGRFRDGVPFDETEVFYNGVMVISSEAAYLSDGVKNMRFRNSDWQWGTYELGKRRWRGINFTQPNSREVMPIPFFFRSEAFMSVKKHFGQANFSDKGPGIMGKDYMNYMIYATEKAYANAEDQDLE